MPRPEYMLLTKADHSANLSGKPPTMVGVLPEEGHLCQAVAYLTRTRNLVEAAQFPRGSRRRGGLPDAPSSRLPLRGNLAEAACSKESPPK